MIRTEAHVKNDVIDALSRDGDFMVWNHPTGTFFTQDGYPVKCGRPGSMDVIGCVRVTITPDMVGRQVGLALGIETKHPTTGGQRETQVRFQRAWEMRGGIYVLTRTHEGLREMILERAKG